MRHLHSSDIDFLEAFHDGTVSSTPVNAIGLLSRADEIGVGRPDAMRSARTIAARCLQPVVSVVDVTLVLVGVVPVVHRRHSIEAVVGAPVLVPKGSLD